MILQKEIATIAEAKLVSKSTVDKDWVLGHFLAAIYSQPELKEVLIFKGGTCLKKCYFPDYRFSEDLDFTSRKKSFELTKKHLQNICEHLHQNTEVLTHIDSLRPLKFKDELTGYEAVIRFWGADHSRNETPPPVERWQTKIKIEIILYELMIFDEAQQEITHQYSDAIALKPNIIPCYSINEVMAEKLRALIQRSYTAPRDFYDIWYLQKNYPNLNFEEIVNAFHKKMAFKNLEFTGVDQLMDEDDDKKLRASWKNSLAHQIQADALPEYDVVKTELKELFKKIFK
jgi:predicted nucleotidyltransferase component of viral defense system